MLITSPTAQTTRHRISAVYNEPHMQMILVDTPGLHKPVDALGEELNISALNALKDVDVVAMLVDGSQEAGRGDEWVAKHVAESKAPKILVISKADAIAQEQAQEQIERMSQYCDFDDVIVLSAKENFNVGSFVHMVAERLPRGPALVPHRYAARPGHRGAHRRVHPREGAAQHPRRGAPLRGRRGRRDLLQREEGPLERIKATIYVERESQKGIIIGAGGEMIKKIGTEARHDLEGLLGNKVYLELNVKVKVDWRSDAAQFEGRLRLRRGRH